MNFKSFQSKQVCEIQPSLSKFHSRVYKATKSVNVNQPELQSVKSVYVNYLSQNTFQDFFVVQSVKKLSNAFHTTKSVKNFLLKLLQEIHAVKSVKCNCNI